jgi:hypothetical protein
MSQQKEIEAEMRLSAIEYLICKLNLAMLTATLPVGQISQKLDEFAQDADKQKFPGLDAAMSDLASAEWQTAIARLVKAQKEMLEQFRAQKGI